MVRARLAFLTLASSLLAITGCASMRNDECSGGGWFSRFHLTSRTKTAAPCECEGGMPVVSSSGPVVVPPDMVPPQSGVILPPAGFTPPPPSIMTNPPTTTQPPRIVPVPQAVPNAYVPRS